jgi:hypothetical protein
MSIFAKDFSQPVRTALAKKGIAIVGAQPIPDMSSGMPWANARRGYILDDNGTCRVRSYQDVLEVVA